MKGYIRISICSLWMAGLFSCSNPLDEKIFSYQNQDNFYSNVQEANLALAGVYGVMWGYIYKDAYHVIMGDLPGVELNAPNVRGEFDMFAWTTSTSHFDNFWLACYNGINRANTLIDGMSTGNIPEASRKSIEGQARFLRALYYFHLVKAFGGVPLHIEATQSLDQVAKPRSSVAETYTQIIEDLKTAESLMGAFSSADHAAGYATSAAARALLAKVYLQNKQWADAAAKAKEVMDLGVYDLIADYAQLWRPESKNGKEHIFSVQNGSSSNVPNMGDNTYFWMAVPRITVSGRQVEFATEGNTRAEVDPVFFNNTPDTYRKWHSIRNKMPYYYNVGSTAIINDTMNLDRAYVVKYFHPDLNTKQLRSGVNTSVVRYADILLTYAEAVNEANGPNAGALDALNRVRRRARGAGTASEQPESVYPDIQAGVTQQELRTIILLERSREFVGEGERRNDLNRHGLFLAAAAAQGSPNVKAGYVLYPIPDVQRGLNPLLTQNPDY